jgi:hypothetical protein
VPPPDLQAALLSTKHPAAVLFDMDGTLVDSEKLWDVASQDLAAVYGGTLSDTARRTMVGASMAASMRITSWPPSSCATPPKDAPTSTGRKPAARHQWKRCAR